MIILSRDEMDVDVQPPGGRSWHPPHFARDYNSHLEEDSVYRCLTQSRRGDGGNEGVETQAHT